ncbi:polysaccharide deacetylase family protein [Pseudoroseomonas cervicalis]|uniref:polysaccharide deacetylase family protein n=1 Tax=Teichococcus cervicalis TaxID=204525 RepID=UPI0022F1C13A|nr:polysaccharide deacetylase family protein [Pseudoroseomonas cervicalis]WBV45329.1 polysaccharide deacetylase family protein [Pseudoroseomonas cervicalis]
MSTPLFAPRPDYVWPEGRRSAFCFSVDVDSDAPYLWGQQQPGDARRLGQLEIRRFGLRQGLPRMLDLLDRYGVRGSFFVPGAVAEANPELLPGLLARGHEVGLHGWFHEIVGQSSEAEFAAALEASIDLFRRQTGAAPRLFRSPAWEMTEPMLAELRRHGLWDSSLMGFDHPYEVEGVVEVPVQWALDDAIFYKFSALPADRGAPWPSAPVLQSWLEEWEALHRLGQMMMLTVHDWISGRAQRLALLEKLLARITAEPACWVATAGEIAAWHAGSANAGRFAVAAGIPPAIGPRRFGGGAG